MSEAGELTRRLPLGERGVHLCQHARLLEYLTAAANDTGERVIRDVHRELGLLLQPPVQTAQKRATARQANSLEHQVCDQLRRRHLDSQAN